MSGIRKVAEKHSGWTILVPVANLELTHAIDFEFRVDRVTFVTREALMRRRRRLGLPQPLSRLKKRGAGLLARFFDEVTTYAVVRWTGKPIDFEEAALQLVREELALLSLSQLGLAKRRNTASPSIAGEVSTGRRSHLFVARDGVWLQNLERYGKLEPLILDADWKAFQRRGFHNELVRIIRGEAGIGKSWHEDIRNAAVLAGQSQASVDLPQAFLWNMIAIELLLTRQGDKYRNALPARAEAFLGWVADWKIDDYEARIDQLYRKRSEFVHDGKRDSINFADLFFADDLLLNLFVNLVRHIEIFSSKDAVIEFSRRVEAEHLLGLKGSVRPKSLRFLKRRYGPKDERLYKHQSGHSSALE